MAFCRVENDRVVEVWDVAELPPLTQEIADLYEPCDAGVQEGYVRDGAGGFEPYVPPVDIEALRLEVKNSIKKYAQNLMADRVEAFDDFAMIDFMATVLWAMLDTTQAGAEILYCKDVYQFAKNELTLANGATQAQLEGYDVTARAWPVMPV